MGITARDKGGGQSFDPIDEGMHHAICYSIYDLGHQYNQTFNKTQHQVLITWELPDERIQIERDGSYLNLPRSISKTYTLSLGEKANLRKDLQTWRGRAFSEQELEGFDITKLLGVNCTLQVLHNKKGDKKYANIMAIVPLQKSIEKKTPENEIRYFSFEDHHKNIPPNTPDWIIDMIKSSDEWHDGKPDNDDIPYPDTLPMDGDTPF